MSKLKKLPNFKSLADEAQFWLNEDSTQYLNWSKANRASFTNLKPSTKTISLRLPESLLNEIKILANKEDIPYQSLMKHLLAQGIKLNSKTR